MGFSAGGHLAAHSCNCYATALARHPVPFETHIYPVGGHGLSTVTEQTCDNLQHEVQRNAIWMTSALEWLELIRKQ